MQVERSAQDIRVVVARPGRVARPRFGRDVRHVRIQSLRRPEQALIQLDVGRLRQRDGLVFGRFLTLRGGVHRQKGIQCARRRVEQRDAAGLPAGAVAVLAADVGAELVRIPFGVREAAVEAVLRARQCRDAPGEHARHDRKIKRGVQVQPIEAAEGKLRFATKLPGRPFRDHLQGSADGVLAEQRPLWPAEDLDPIDVEQFEHRARGSGQVDAVDVDADTRILRDDEIRLTDAADEHLGEVAAAARIAGGRELHVRRGIGDPAQVPDVALAEGLPAQHRDRHRHVLRVLLAPARRHGHHFLAPADLQHDVLEHAGVAAAEREVGDRGLGEARERDRQRVDAGGEPREREAALAIGENLLTGSRRLVPQHHDRARHLHVRLVHHSSTELGARLGIERSATQDSEHHEDACKLSSAPSGAALRR